MDDMHHGDAPGPEHPDQGGEDGGQPAEEPEHEKEAQSDQLEEDWVVPVVDADLAEPFLPVIPEALMPTVVANEWNPDFFGRNPLFLEPMELDKKTPAGELTVLRTPHFSIAW